MSLKILQRVDFIEVLKNLKKSFNYKEDKMSNMNAIDNIKIPEDFYERIDDIYNEIEKSKEIQIYFLLRKRIIKILKYFFQQ